MADGLWRRLFGGHRAPVAPAALDVLAAPLDTWTQRILAIRDALMTLEINTITGDDISAQKMPEVPLALHSLVQCYSGYLERAGYYVTKDLLLASIRRAGGLHQPPTAEAAQRVLRQLEFWPFAQRLTTLPSEPGYRGGGGLLTVDASEAVTELTNGVETFEALQWVGWGALQHARALETPPPHLDIAILTRIYANCRQVKEAAMRLEQVDRGVAAVAARLREALSPEQHAHKLQQATRTQLFGATVEETARSLFVSPRPVFSVDPDVTVLIRKAWDIGADKVSVQTVMQVDGDVLQVVAPMDPDQRAFVTAMHRESVKDGISQWRTLFEVLATAAKDLAGLIARAV